MTFVCMNSRTSDYLAMGSVGLPSDCLPGEGYLFMTNAESRIPIARDSGIHSDSINSELRFSNKLRMVNEELPNSLEMHPMLGRMSPIQVETGTKINGFSNPNYQNPPAIKCSDLDDIPVATKKSTPLATGNQLYINISQSPASEDEEPHYVNPKNNARIV